MSEGIREHREAAKLMRLVGHAWVGSPKKKRVESMSLLTNSHSHTATCFFSFGLPKCPFSIFDLSPTSSPRVWSLAIPHRETTEGLTHTPERYTLSGE